MPNPEGNADANFSILGRIPLMLLSNEKTARLGVKNKRPSAARAENYALKVLCGRALDRAISHAAGEDATSDCCDSCDKLRPHDDRPGRYQPGLTRNSPSGQRWRKCYRPSSPLPAELIAEMVRLRWVIEMFFRMFK